MTRPGIQRRHFHTFDALRAFAVIKVLLQHLPIEAFPWFNYVKSGGYIGVHFFFVLSGFLITYIICTEKLVTGTLNLKNFFARRILRIWPLFYFIIALCYLLPPVLKSAGMSLSSVGYEPSLWVSLLFLENYKMIGAHDLPNFIPMAVTWSLCVEEHFYILWGLVLYALPVKHLPKFIITCIISGVIARLIFAVHNLDPSDISTHIDLFAYGAIPAYLLIRHEQSVISWVNKIPRYLQAGYIILLPLFLMFMSQYWHPVWNATLFGVLFCFLLVLTLPPHGFIRISERNIFSRLGIYTYGIYLYHLFVIVACKKLFDRLSLSLDNAAFAVLYTIICLATTLLISYLSYRYFEKPFLKLKKKFRQRNKQEEIIFP